MPAPLRFPPVFGGDYSDPTTWVVLVLIIGLVIGGAVLVRRLLSEETVD